MARIARTMTARPTWRLVILAFVLFPAFACAGCGAKNSAPDPARNVPPKVRDLMANGVPGRVTLHFAPADEAAEVSGYQIFRKNWPADQTPDPATGDTYLMTEKPATPPEGQSRFVWTDGSIKEGIHYEYHVFAFKTLANAEKVYGPDTATAPFKAVFPEQPVMDVSATPPDGAVRIGWRFEEGATPAQPKTDAEGKQTPPSEGACVNVYRAEGEEGPFSPEPINPEPLFNSEYADHQVLPRVTYRYKLRRATCKPHVVLEGAFSAEVSAEVVDKTPPPEPVVMWIKAIEGAVRLRWMPVDDKGLLGYVVERRLSSEPENAFAPVSGLLSVDEYTDRSVVGQNAEFAYRVAARDRAGNLSHSLVQILAYPPVEPDRLSTDDAQSDATDDAQNDAANDAPVNAPQDAAEQAPEPASDQSAAPAETDAPALAPLPKP